MNLLYVVPYAPTPIRTRPYNLLRQLALRGHALTLATVWTNGEEQAALEQMAVAGVRVIAMHLSPVRTLWNCVQTLPQSVPMQAEYCWHPELARRVASELDTARFDLIHVEHLRGAHYGLYLSAHRGGLGPRPPILWDSVDSISSLFEQAAAHSRSALSRAIANFELPRTRRYEARLARHFNHTLVASSQERKAFERLLHNAPEIRSREWHPDDSQTMAKITALRNGVDLSFFAPLERERAPRTIVMTGKMSYHANVTAGKYLVEEIMPRVWREIPGATVQIAGQNPPSQLIRLARASHGRVQITGTVRDLRPYLQRATMAVAPMVYSAGIQNKLLEAMATATPVVATPNALEALAVEPEREVLVAANAEAFARQIVRLARDENLRRKIGQNGRRYVELNHDWGQVAVELESVYHTLIWNRHA